MDWQTTVKQDTCFDLPHISVTDNSQFSKNSLHSVVYPHSFKQPAWIGAVISCGGGARFAHRFFQLHGLDYMHFWKIQIEYSSFENLGEMSRQEKMIDRWFSFLAVSFKYIYKVIEKHK